MSTPDPRDPDQPGPNQPGPDDMQGGVGLPADEVDDPNNPNNPTLTATTRGPDRSNHIGGTP